MVDQGIDKDQLFSDSADNVLTVEHWKEGSWREGGNAVRVRFPANFTVPAGSQVDICLILKEHPTLAVDFTAQLDCKTLEDCLKAIAKTVVVNGNHIGEKIFADVVKNYSTDEYELYVTKPYLETAMMTVHFVMPDWRPVEVIQQVS